jgi:acetyl esterase/lipase
MGGNFAAIIAQEQRGKRAPVLQLLIYPGLDLVSDTPSMHDFADAWPLTAETVDFFMKHYLPPGADPSDPRVSPGRTQDLKGLAPALVYTAGFDMLLDQGAAYAQRLQEAGVKATYHCFESLPHGFVAFPAAARAAEEAIRRIARETASALKGQS